ncbi:MULTISPECIES: hypothetical protein [unclassified Streptomyces]|uniref:hypothetical protein n=1 Tax=unclassified Streptomyces TaxID=2593676 RepID=UPI000DB9F850|nr:MULTISPECIES: hypothetical protein [unclassified Streptomyces]MYT70314.1 hypothetical protein [Streptomyces sp. SID8367]RAJ88893.1 hypothetical protein K377_02357 [Streptomyces sp. PsTaAH-137]
MLKTERSYYLYRGLLLCNAHCERAYSRALKHSVDALEKLVVNLAGHLHRKVLPNSFDERAVSEQGGD